jgi:excisionase family DNA binding protein
MKKTQRTRRSKAGAARDDSDLAVTTFLNDDSIAVGALGTYDAARYLGISIPTLRRQIRAGRLIPNRYTRHLLFSVRELNRWIAEGQVE